MVVIAGGDFTRFEAGLIRPETDLIITADAGAMSLEAHGLVPDIAVGILTPRALAISKR